MTLSNRLSIFTFVRTKDTGGPDRGMSLQSKVHLAAIAQGEADADMRDLDRSFAAVTQRIATTKTLMDVHMTLMATESNPVQKASLQNTVMGYVTKLQELDKELERMSARKRTRNDIVAEVMNHGRVSLGLKRSKDETDEKMQDDIDDNSSD